jgi:hypothetical protein
MILSIVEKILSLAMFFNIVSGLLLKRCLFVPLNNMQLHGTASVGFVDGFAVLRQSGTGQLTLFGWTAVLTVLATAVVTHA